MDEIIMAIGVLVQNEYMRASGIFGPFNNSDHESFAVILEEYQESMENYNISGRAVDDFWNMVKKDADPKPKIEVLRSLFQNAILCASELVQVAAMAKKAELTIKQREGIYEQ